MPFLLCNCYSPHYRFISVTNFSVYIMSCLHSSSSDTSYPSCRLDTPTSSCLPSSSETSYPACRLKTLSLLHTDAKAHKRPSMRWLMLKLCILFLTIPILHAEPIEFHIPPLILSPRSALRSNGAIRNSHAFSNLADAAALKGSEEAALLLAFKASVTGDPSGALSTWKNGSSPCSWQGIKCNSRGSVSSITLQNLGLSGVFSPNTLSDLPHLTSLDLSSNNFTGSLPPSFCNSDKHSLTDLILFNNSFHGRIPSALQNCTSLVKISMYSNRLSGPMPTELASLSNLEYLALSFNHLKGNIPIPFLTNCTRLTFLALSQNEITGLLPAEIGLLANLTTLWLDSNSITGPIPSELGNLTSLTLLQLDTNRLTGQIPASLGKLTELTEVLSLSMNQLTGPIPTQIARLTKLNIMTLRGNSLNGSIPKELSNMQAIQGLFLQENSLEGTIPAELGNCTNLQQLRIYSNHLTGSIPDALGTLQYLTELNLHTNMLQGLLPTSLANLSALQKLALGFNALEGPISPALASQSMLNLSMPHNHFNGSIPSSIGNMIHVQHIDLSANNLSGSVPEDIERCLGMMNLNISHNALTGEIPSSFELLDLLEILDLSWNIFSGGIPSFLANLTNLQYINLSNNNLTGPIPSTGVFSKMNATSFLNNPGLCGAPLENNCTQPTSLDSSFEDRGIALGFKICIVISCFLFICMVLLMARYFWRKKQTVTESDDGLLKASEYSKNFRRFTPKELEIATDNFSDSSLIGMGGASKVYKAVDLTIRMVPKIEQANAAVKVLSIDNGQNLFSRELEALGTLRHRNLVKLYGFCVQGNLYAIVLEYLPKGSLQDWIYGPDAQIVSINMRLSIALDVAHGLAYLHHGLRRPMVHRDVKPSNVLFDEDMVAKVSDFGIAKLLNQDEIVSMARGTLGYIAPEYAELTRVDTKGDVYGFGILMLEMLTKKRPTDEMFVSMEFNLPMWVKEAYPERIRDILDPQLMDPDLAYEEEEAVKAMLSLSLSCTEIRPSDRPNMETVVQTLTAIVSSLSPSALSQRKSCTDNEEDVPIMQKYSID